MADNKNRDEQSDLKRREYKDEEGNVHHHTHPYMEEHGGESGRSRSSANDAPTAERKPAGSSASSSGAAAHPLTDHNEIRRWAESRGAKPTCVRGTGGKRGKNDPGMIRLDFPGFTGAESLEPISWDDWFRAFDENNLALLVQEKTAGGEKSNFNKLVSRDSASEK